MKIALIISMSPICLYTIYVFICIRLCTLCISISREHTHTSLTHSHTHPSHTHTLTPHTPPHTLTHARKHTHTYWNALVRLRDSYVMFSTKKALLLRKMAQYAAQRHNNYYTENTAQCSRECKGTVSWDFISQFFSRN